jgi:PadR family transcriptional regulator PadR
MGTRNPHRTEIPPGTLDMLVLKTISRSPMHGYGIAEHIHQMSEDVLEVEEGSLYPALHRLEAAGWIKARWTTTDKGRRARVYEITAAGRRQLESEEERWRAITAAVGKILKHA